MTVHKLSAVDGYTYLTRQVASADERRSAGQALADYYTAHGSPPGVRLGGGAATLGIAEPRCRTSRCVPCSERAPTRSATLCSPQATKVDTRLGRPTRSTRPRTNTPLAVSVVRWPATT